jgi:hypothetical protein
MTIERVRDAIWQAINPDGGPAPAMAPLVEIYERAARAAMRAATAPRNTKTTTGVTYHAMLAAAPEAPSDAVVESLAALREKIRTHPGRIGAACVMLWIRDIDEIVAGIKSRAALAALRPDGQTGGK